MIVRVSVLAVCFCFASSMMMAQTKVVANRAELSVPFGTVAGATVLLADYLIFIDERQMESSFAISRNEIQNITSEGDGFTIETRRPIRDRTGERNRFSFRLNEGDRAAVISWSKTPLPETSTTTPATNPQTMSFPAEFTQFLGRNSRGRLMVTSDMVAYESIDNVQSSRRWQFKDIKEIKMKNPYEIEIEPFVGDKYNLKLEGKGMDTSDFRIIVDRITAARIAP